MAIKLISFHKVAAKMPSIIPPTFLKEYFIRNQSPQTLIVQIDKCTKISHH